MNIISSNKNAGNACTKLVKTRTDITFNAFGIVQTYFFIDLSGNYVAPTMKLFFYKANSTPET